jgi:hypothetical protein
MLSAPLLEFSFLQYIPRFKQPVILYPKQDKSGVVTSYLLYRCAPADRVGLSAGRIPSTIFFSFFLFLLLPLLELGIRDCISIGGYQCLSRSREPSMKARAMKETLMESMRRVARKRSINQQGWMILYNLYLCLSELTFIIIYLTPNRSESIFHESNL